MNRGQAGGENARNTTGWLFNIIWPLSFRGGQDSTRVCLFACVSANTHISTSIPPPKQGTGDRGQRGESASSKVHPFLDRITLMASKVKSPLDIVREHAAEFGQSKLASVGKRATDMYFRSRGVNRTQGRGSRCPKPIRIVNWQRCG